MSPLKQTVCDLFWPRLSSDPVASVTGKQKATAPAFYMRGSSETWLMSGLGLFSLMIYVLTLSRGVDPGVSATSVSMVLHLCADAPVNHPL